MNDEINSFTTWRDEIRWGSVCVHRWEILEKFEWLGEYTTTCSHCCQLRRYAAMNLTLKLNLAKTSQRGRVRKSICVPEYGNEIVEKELLRGTSDCYMYKSYGLCDRLWAVSVAMSLTEFATAVYIEEISVRVLTDGDMTYVQNLVFCMLLYPVAKMRYLDFTVNV